MPTESELDNILVRQKDWIIRMIDDGKFNEAQFAIAILVDLWCRCSYGYKIDELIERINLMKRNTNE